MLHVLCIDGLCKELCICINIRTEEKGLNGWQTMAAFDHNGEMQDKKK